MDLRSLAAHPPPPSDPVVRAQTKRALNVIAVIALADAVLLGFLLYASFTDNENLVHVLGPLHGFGFVILIYLCIRGAGEQRWGWWYPLIVVFTGGPPGSLIGDWIVRRQLAQTA